MKSEEKNNSDNIHRGDEKLFIKLLSNKYIAVLVVCVVIFFGIAKLIDDIAKTKENIPKILASDNKIENVKNDTDKISKTNSELNLSDLKKGETELNTPNIESVSLEKEVPSILEFEISEKFSDENGIGLKGVEVWCKNCQNTEREETDDRGNFKLIRKIEVINTGLQGIRICYDYKGNGDCIWTDYKNINFKPPKLIKK